MSKYLLQVSYTADGAKGLLKDGGTKRRSAAQAAVESTGGKIESFYFALGETDVFVIVDMPDQKSAAAVSLTIGASGAATSRTTALLAPEELDEAVKKPLSYTPPGR